MTYRVQPRWRVVVNGEYLLEMLVATFTPAPARYGDEGGAPIERVYGCHLFSRGGLLAALFRRRAVLRLSADIRRMQASGIIIVDEEGSVFDAGDLTDFMDDTPLPRLHSRRDRGSRVRGTRTE